MCTEYVENCRHISYESYEPLRFLGAVNHSLGMTQPSWKKAAYLGRRQRTWKRNHLDLQKFNIFCTCGLLYFWAVWTFPTKTHRSGVLIVVHSCWVIFHPRALQHEFPMPAEAPNFPSDPFSHFLLDHPPISSWPGYGFQIFHWLWWSLMKRSSCFTNLASTKKTDLGHCWVNQSLYPRVPNLDIRTVRTLCHQLSVA